MEKASKGFRNSDTWGDIAEDGTVDQAVKARINAAWLKWKESAGILCGRRCSRALKGKVYRSVIRPAMLYGSECWLDTARQDQERGRQGSHADGFGPIEVESSG